ncbi:MAG TPA: multidrug efflux RND transporter permease subunit [Vicinamibacterales bacterium]|jgi:HAE1 family hydrophobic/amphiphilic exporter-1|nr:multidrug efflux RND transporter permease subunit [Vicinamibacterales bacterium]
MFVDVFIRRPILASVCSLVLILAGLLAIPTMPIAQYPNLAPPQINVTAIYTGANAQEVETAVTTPLEQAINGVEGMLYMTSSSTNSGVATVTVTFDITRDQDVAAVDVQNRVNTALGRMPADVRTNGITVQKQATGFIAAVGVYAEHGEYDSLFLSNYLDVFVRDAIKRVPGVSDVIIFGERRYSMRVWLDPQKMAARGVTASDVVSALRAQNVQVAAGSLGQPPAPSGQMYQLSVRAIGQLTEPGQFDNIIVKTGANAALVRIKDIGRTELGAETYSSDLRFQGVSGVGFGVIQLPTANALDVYEAVTTELQRLAKQFPPGMKYQVAFNTTDVVQESIREVLKTLVEAIILVVLVIFIFLQTWRSTIIPTITIPVSLIGAFAFVKLMGFSINTLTLFGIILATGIVVDDAIVVIENIERHIQQFHVPAHKAASDAMREVLSAVIATALVLIAVFVPVAFFPGTTGRLYAQFSMTIAFAVALSAFNAVTLTPALSALLLERESHEKGRFFTFFEQGIAAGTRQYVKGLRGALRLRWVVVLVFFAALGATYVVYQRVPQAFVPEEDEGYFIVNIQAPAGASLQYTGDIAKQAEQIIMKDPDVMALFSVGGFSFSGAASNTGLMFVRLRPFNQRKGDQHSLQAILGRVSGPLFSIPGAIVVAFTPPSIPGLSRFGGFEFQVLDQTGSDITALAGATQSLVGAGNQSGVLRGLFSPFTANDPQLVVTIDRQRALALGLPLDEITNAMQVFLGSQYVNDFEFNNRAYRVYVQADQQFRANPQALKELYARTAKGTMIPLEQVVTVKETTAPQVISHFNLFRSATINGSAAPGVSSGDALKKMEQLAASTLPQGFGYSWSGISLEETKAGRQSFVIFSLALLLVYLTLAAQYESLVLPFIVLLGVPLAVLGALSAQWLRGLSNDVYCQVGLVMLIGLAAKNAILIVEFAEQLRNQGRTILEAAVEAARIRLRPILMTSLAFILGVLPLVFATGAGQEARHSVGTAVAGGMVVSTFLNIVFIPVLYVVIETLRERFGALNATVNSEPTTLNPEP